MLQHLCANYDKITALKLLLYYAAMKTDYDANLSIDNLFEQIDTAVEYTATELEPYTPKQIITISFQLIFKTGIPNNFKLWKCRVTATKTYAEFKLVFTVVHPELHESQATTVGGGFHTNSVTQKQDHFEALANLARATANDCGSMVTLTETNKLLTENLDEALETIATLTAHLEKSAPYEQNKCGIHYCWSKFNQNSKDCTSPAEGHKYEATFNKKMVVSTTTFRGCHS